MCQATCRMPDGVMAPRRRTPIPWAVTPHSTTADRIGVSRDGQGYLPADSRGSVKLSIRDSAQSGTLGEDGMPLPCPQLRAGESAECRVPLSSLTHRSVLRVSGVPAFAQVRRYGWG